MVDESEYVNIILGIASELTSIDKNCVKATELAVAIKNLRKKIVTEYLPDSVPLKLPEYHEEIIVGWNCPICFIDNTYSGSREDTNYYDICRECKLSVELMPDG